MALAPERHVAAFVDHYRAKGAGRIRVYFDAAETPDAAVVGLAHGDLVACDAAFWAPRGGRPGAVEHRQRVVYAEAYSSLEADWLLVVDVDEFMLDGPDVGEVLSAAPETREAVIFPTVEAVWRAGDDLTREYGSVWARKSYHGPCSDQFAALIYGGRGAFFVHGLLAHHMGKHAVRRGRPDLMVCIHESKRDGKPLKAVRARDPRTGRTAWLLHHDAIGLDAWRAKWDRRLASKDVVEMGRRRRRQQAAYAAARADGREAALFADLYALRPWQAGLLRRLGLLTPI